MRKVLWLLVFVFVAFVSCNDEVQRSYWENAKLKSELRYVDGKLNGECRWYYSTGQMVMQANYVDDLKEGWAVRWHENGQMQSEGWYKHDHLDSIYCKRGI